MPCLPTLTTWSAIASMRASVMVCKFGLAIFISHFLELASLGLFGLIVGACAICPVVIGMGLSQMLTREAVSMSPDRLLNELRHYFGYIALVYAIALSVAVLLSAVIDLPVIWAVAIGVMLFEHLGNDTFVLLSNLQRPLLSNLGAFLRGAAWIMAYIPLAMLNPGLRTLTALMLFWLAGGALAFLVFVHTVRTWPWKAAFAKPREHRWVLTHVRDAFLVYLSDLSYVAMLYLDRYLVTLFLGLRFAGVYVLYWTVANAAFTFVSMVVLQQQRPLLIKAHHAGAAAHRKAAARLLRATTVSITAVCLAIGAVFQVASPSLNQPLVSEYLPAFWLIIAGTAARCLADFGAMTLFSAHRDAAMTVTNVGSVVALLSVEVALIPLFGLYGAGSAMIISFSTIAAWQACLVFLSNGMPPRPQNGASASWWPTSLRS
jgi:O-antigen/teichoic acid export membrane protein